MSCHINQPETKRFYCIITLEIGNDVEGEIRNDKNKIIRKGTVLAQLNIARYQIAISSELFEPAFSC